MGKARARHKMVNGQLKNWNALKNVFCHSHLKYHTVFRAVLVIEQIKIQNGQPPFQVEEINNPVMST